MLLLLALALGTCLACSAGPGSAGTIGLVDGRLRPCPGSPNCVCSEEPGRASAIEPLAFPGDPDAAFRSLIEFLSAEPRAALIRVDGEYAHFVFRTALFGFRDDLELRLDRAAGVIQVRSASRVGYSDLGTNRRRVESIRNRWEPPEV